MEKESEYEQFNGELLILNVELSKKLKKTLHKEVKKPSCSRHGWQILIIAIPFPYGELDQWRNTIIIVNIKKLHYTKY